MKYASMAETRAKRRGKLRSYMERDWRDGLAYKVGAVVGIEK
jgi:hypothetical protein